MELQGYLTITYWVLMLPMTHAATLTPRDSAEVVKSSNAVNLPTSQFKAKLTSSVLVSTDSRRASPGTYTSAENISKVKNTSSTNIKATTYSRKDLTMATNHKSKPTRLTYTETTIPVTTAMDIISNITAAVTTITDTVTNVTDIVTNVTDTATNGTDTATATNTSPNAMTSELETKPTDFITPTSGVSTSKVITQKTSTSRKPRSTTFVYTTGSEKKKKTNSYAAVLNIVIPVTICLLVTIMGSSCFFLYKLRKHNLEPHQFINLKLRTQRQTIPSVVEIEMDTEEVEGKTSVDIKSSPIPVSDLKDHIRKLKEKNGFGIEYRAISQGPRASHKMGIAHLATGRNRYKDVLPYDKNRVKLVKNDAEQSDYINASFINGYKKDSKFIAAQGPTDFTLVDFWRMIWDYHCPVVVMLTSLVERNFQKCVQYWPSLGEVVSYDNIVVRTLRENTDQNITTRILHISKEGEEREVIQLHTGSWEDMGAPRNSTCVLKLRDLGQTNQEGPTIVHCSAGIGRTGTYIAVDYLLEQALDTDQVDVIACVNSLRNQRVNMVQSTSQYQLIYDAVLEGLFVGSSTSYTPEEFPVVYREWMDEAPEDTPQRLRQQIERCSNHLSYLFHVGNNMIGMIVPEMCRAIHQVLKEDYFQVLDVLKPLLKESDSLVGKFEDNVAKNRTMDILPVSDKMVLLKSVGTISKLSACYINAVNVDGYTKKNSLIVTQMPLPETVGSFWRMVLEQGSPCILMLNKEDEQKDDSAYWPGEGTTSTWDNVKVKNVTSVHNEALPFVVHQLEITGCDEQKHKVNLLVVKQSVGHMTGTRMVTLFIRIMARLLDYRGSWDKPLIVHCLDGATYSGLMCGIINIVDMVQACRLVDIYQTVKQLQQSRPQFISDIEQYKLLHEAVSILAKILPKASQGNATILEPQVDDPEENDIQQESHQDNDSKSILNKDFVEESTTSSVNCNDIDNSLSQVPDTQNDHCSSNCNSKTMESE